MIPEPNPSKEAEQNDVRYRIAECRKRLRNQRTILRAQHHLPTEAPRVDDSMATSSVESYAEILATVSMSQGSLSRLVECLLGPVETSTHESHYSAEQEEAAIT